ncbi:MAG: hypothetical protein V7K50_11560 [Nostoc sp.]|uniref:hypothetical protein n=1 Tax=Nostoc sp. TaxID=1180 RepID=UPI002FFBEAAA
MTKSTFLISIYILYIYLQILSPPLSYIRMGHWVWGIGDWGLVLSVPLWGSKLRVASRREAVGAASRREVLGTGDWVLRTGQRMNN